MAKKISQLPAASAFDGTELLEVVQGGASKQARAGFLLPPGYIEGLKMVWVGPKAITITTGAAYVPGLGRLMRVAADVALTGLTTTASAWYHVYLYDNAGTPAIEFVTTAPSVPYNGTARTKTGDTSRRYLGSVLTDASGNIYSFKQSGLEILYQVNLVIGSLPMRILSNGQSTAVAVVAAGTVVPPTSQKALLRMSNTDTAIQFNLSAGDYSLTAGGSDGQYGVAATAKLFSNVALDSSQQLKYFFAAAPTGGAYLDVLGYTFER